MNKTNIRLGNTNDLQNIRELYKEVVEDINNVKKINMYWNEFYPFCVLDKDINNGEMYVIEDDKKIVGAFSLSTFDDPDYHEIKWNSNNKKWFYINRLVILPSMQGKGYAKIAMNYIINYAKENNYEYIRLTVHNENKYAIGLYESFGFTKIEQGQWMYEGETFKGFELKI